MTELSTAPTTSPANSTSDGNASPQDAGQTPVAPAAASASTVLALLEIGGWKILHNLETTDKNSVVIDHLAVGPGGIFVIDARSWTPSLSSTLGPEQDAIISASGALATQVRMLLPPLARQYVVPLLTYVDASPMSMLRGSIQICTTSMLQGVITSRRPVLNAGEVDDVVTSLSGGLRSSSGAATATSPPSAASTRRGFLRKNSRAAAVDSPSPPPVPAAAAQPVAPPLRFPAPPALAHPAFGNEPVPVDAVWAPVEADAEASDAADEQVAITASEPDDTTAADLVEDLAHPVVPADSTWDLEPEPELHTHAHTDQPEPVGITEPETALAEPEVQDLAHPVVPADSTWDLEPEPELHTHAHVDQPEPLGITEPVSVVTTTTAGPLEPSLAAAALSMPPAPAPTDQRKPGARRKAASQKTGFSRLLPTRTPRTTAGASRRAAVTANAAETDSSQEPDLADASDDGQLTHEFGGASDDGTDSHPMLVDERFSAEDELGEAHESEAADWVEDSEGAPQQEPPATVSEPEPPRAKEPRRLKMRRAKRAGDNEEAEVDLSQMPANLSAR
jgi:hypothetical protein